MPKRKTQLRKWNEQMARTLDQLTSGDVTLGEVVSYRISGPSGASISVDHGGGRIIDGMDGDATSYPPGVTVLSTRGARGAVSQPGTLAPRRLQPNDISQRFAYDPTNVLGL